ncbi:MAG TPA: peptidase E [Ktedonobacterales bacterium]|nr:peptidase E [Ktedonobacterales bacterium]
MTTEGAAPVADRRRIVAIGGCGFDAEAGDGALFRYLIALTGKQRPEVCFIPTASGENPDYTIGFYQTFNALGCATRHLHFFPNPPTADLRGYLLACDLIYVGGGNTKSMLALWREWGVDAILREAWERGIVLSGVSAGSICWFEQGLTDSIPGPLTPLPCLGFLTGSDCPHFDGEPERRPTLHRLLAEGAMIPGYAADDHAALRFDGETLTEVIATRPGARAYSLRAENGQVTETPLEARLLE